MTSAAAFAAAVAVLAAGGALNQRFATSPRRAEYSAKRSERTRRPSRRTATLMGAACVAAVAGPFIAGIGCAAIIGWPRLCAVLEQRRRRESIRLAVPDGIELLVLVIRAGLTPHQAVVAMVEQAPEPLQPGFTAVVARTERGEGLADALHALPDVLGPALVTVADTLSISERHGSPIGDALSQLSIEARQHRRRLAEADARKLPVRLSFPLVLCTLPSFVLVAIAPAVLAALSSLGDTTW